MLGRKASGPRKRVAGLPKKKIITLKKPFRVFLSIGPKPKCLGFFVGRKR
jgi:hypothetical protein